MGNDKKEYVKPIKTVLDELDTFIGAIKKNSIRKDLKKRR